MPGSPINTEHIDGASAVVPVKERREIRRVDVALRLRLRPADYSSRDFEDVQVTLNASRKALYFLSGLDCYQPGMRVIVTRLCGANGVGAWEERGRVVRVQRRERGYGVVVQLETRSPLAKSYVPKPTQRDCKQRTERRRAGRKQFTAAAEVTDVRTGTCMRGRISDLSLQGCYVDTLNPLPAGSTVRLQIFQDGQTLDALANVSSHHPGWGMGLAFDNLTQEQRLLLENWLSGPPAPLESRTAPSGSPASSPVRIETNESYAARLVQLLARKGVLSQSEAMEILDGKPKS